MGHRTDDVIKKRKYCKFLQDFNAKKKDDFGAYLQMLVDSKTLASLLGNW